MSEDLGRRCGGLLLAGFDGHRAPDELLDRVSRGLVGGVILFARNIETPAQTARLLASLRRAEPPDRPLFLAVEQEGGRVQRLRHPPALWPPMARLGLLDRPELTRDVGRALGRDLHALGFNLDFAPVLDVVSSDENSVIGDRSFGADPERVAVHGLALARGLLDGGVVPCGKHFPGHGGPVADSHLTLPHERRSEQELRRVDRMPFSRFARAAMPMLMSAHVLYEHLDEHHPGTLSRRICTDLLRRELGFAGVLASDDMEMGAIFDRFDPGEAAVAAVEAGCDLLLLCRRAELQHQAHEALCRRAAADPAFARRVDQANHRLDHLRRQLPSPCGLTPKQAEAAVRAERHADLLAKIS